MPIRNHKGEIISEKDAQIFGKMLKESLENHANMMGPMVPALLADGSKEVGETIIENYWEAASTVGATIESFAKGKKSISVEDVLQKVYANVYEKTQKECKGYPREDIELAFKSLVAKTGDDSQAKYYGDGYKAPQNDEATVTKLVDEFHLAVQPMPGASELTDYNPASDRVVGLGESRMGNSTTYAKLKDQMNQGGKTKLTEADKALFSFNTAAETARIFSTDLMNKKTVGFADLYEAFTSINETLRLGDPNGGKMRGQQVSAGVDTDQEIKGVGSAKCPAAMYNTMSAIADNMNRIKQTSNPALQKTQAIQLAAFTYQMTLSEHLFDDANGRTCRLMSDVILQSFGLPPHTPSKEETSLCHTVDEHALDYEKGTEVFMKGVQLSDKVVKEQKQAEQAKADPKEREKRAEAGKRVTELRAEAATREYLLVEDITPESVAEVKNFRAQVKHAKSVFKNSLEYNQFDIMVDSYAAFVESINTAKEKKQTQIDLNKLPSFTKKLALGTLQNEAPKNGVIDLDQAGKVMSAFVQGLNQTAQQYEDYKMKDHTMDPKRVGPDVKLLNKDDIRKLNLVRQVMNKPPLPNVSQKAPAQPQKAPGGPQM